MSNILVVDDEKKMLRILEIGLKTFGNIYTASNGIEAIKILNEYSIDIIVTDVKMPRMNGIDLLKAAKKKNDLLPVIIMTAFQDVPVAVESMKCGAYDFLMKPVKLSELKKTIKKILKENTLSEKFSGISNIIGNSSKIKEITALVKKICDTNATVLITGESGTGKELIAKAIHYESNKRSNSFVAVNTAAIPKELLESELFGHVKGSFTSAVSNKTGKFLAANGGTIFLDEIADMNYDLQAKLLRVIEEKIITPVGSHENIELDLRIVSATNRSLKEMVDKNEFREDLYYRLNVIPVHLPPLRERKEDIPIISDHFIKKYSENKTFSSEVIDIFKEYLWPGNIRELENTIKRACILSATDNITKNDLPEEVRFSIGNDLPTTREALKEAKIKAKEAAVKNIEKSFVLGALVRTKGNIAQAAKEVEMDRSQFMKLLKKHNVDSQQIKKELENK